MRNYGDTRGLLETPEVVLADLVKEVQASAQTIYIEFNGVHLVVTPCEADSHPRFLAQLLWTYYMASQKKVVVGRRPVFHNLVPEFCEAAEILMTEFEQLPLRNPYAVLIWLERLIPVTFCRWAWSHEQDREVVQRLADSEGPAETGYTDWQNAVLSDEPPMGDSADRRRFYIMAVMRAMRFFHGVPPSLLQEIRRELSHQQLYI